MNKPLPIWAALPFGALCGAVLGTIVASFYLTLALRTGFANFDMLAVWRASDGLRRAHPEAFKVAFGAVGFGVIGLAGLAFAWTWQKERDEYGFRRIGKTSWIGRKVLLRNYWVTRALIGRLMLRCSFARSAVRALHSILTGYRRSADLPAFDRNSYK